VVADPLAPSETILGWIRGLAGWLPSTVTEAARLVALPFRPTTAPAVAAAALARVGWFVLVWAIFGTAISRCVALKLAGEEPIGPLGAVAYGSRKWPPAFNSVVFVLVGIAALSVPGALLGLAMRTEWGLSLAGAVWPLVLLGAVVLAILAVGLVAQDAADGARGEPEARGEVVDSRSDLYSTGCLLYELLTGRPPFTGESPVSIAYQHVSEAPVTPAPFTLASARTVPRTIPRRAGWSVFRIGSRGMGSALKPTSYR
jgi:hypothetical protein